LAFALCRGGWPASLSRSENAALQTARNYIESIVEQDASRVDGIEKNPERMRLLLRSLARNIATQANIQTLQDDVEASDIGLSDKTIALYLNSLRKIFVLEDLSAWEPSLRSKTALRTHVKRHFVDPSLAVAVLRLRPSGLFTDLRTFGFLFESLCTRDVRVYAQSIDGDVFHYRDKSGLECDLIVRLRDGRWGAIEVKLGPTAYDEAAKNLLSLQKKVNDDKMGKPSFLMILSTGNIAYRRPDGIWVVPIGCLRN
jgi:predicted AAA+ superfamily ATPase